MAAIDRLTAFDAACGLKTEFGLEKNALRRCYSEIPRNNTQIPSDKKNSFGYEFSKSDGSNASDLSSVASSDCSIYESEWNEDQVDFEGDFGYTEASTYFFIKETVVESPKEKPKTKRESSLRRLLQTSDNGACAEKKPRQVAHDLRSRNSSYSSSASSTNRQFDFRLCLNCAQLYACAGQGESEIVSLEGQRWKYCSGECHITHLSSVVNRQR